MLTASNIAGLGIVFLTNIILAKLLSPDGYGLYSLSVAIITFVALLGDFGYFPSCAVLISKSKGRDEKKLLISSFLILVLISILSVLFVFLLSIPTEYFFGEEVSLILKYVSVATPGFIFPIYMDMILKGMNKIEHLAIYNFSSKLILMAVFFVLYLLEQLNVVTFIYALALSAVFSAIAILFSLGLKMNVSFEYLKSTLSNIFEKKRSYGMSVFISRLIDTVTFNFDRVLIGYFVAPKSVGFYSMSNSISSPISIFSVALSGSKFKEFSKGSLISRKLSLTNLSVSFALLIMANILGFIVVQFFLGAEYHDMKLMILLLSLAVFFQSLYSPYNSWLVANGCVREIKFKTRLTCVANIILMVTLIPAYGAVGAAIASLVSMLLSLITYFYFYNSRKVGNAS